MASTPAADLATLLGDLGTAVTLRTYVAAYDPAAGVNTRAPTDVAVSAQIAAYSVEETDGALVQHGDLKVSVAAAGLTTAPTGSTVVILNGEEWSVQSVRPRYALGSLLSYQLQARR